MHLNTLLLHMSFEAFNFPEQKNLQSHTDSVDSQAIAQHEPADRITTIAGRQL